MTEMGDQPLPTPSKTQLRSWVRARRRALEGSVTDDIEQGFAESVLGSADVRAALDERPHAPVLVYVETLGEPPTGALRRRLRLAGNEVFVPWAQPGRKMAWLPDHGSARPWGLPGVGGPGEATIAFEDSQLLARQPSVLILPALAATSAGARLGQGGGYYDTFLAACPTRSAGGPLRVALVWPWEVVDELPVDPHDQPVDLVVSYWPA